MAEKTGPDEDLGGGNQPLQHKCPLLLSWPAGVTVIWYHRSIQQSTAAC